MKNGKKLAAILATLLLFGGCAATKQSPTEITVFAAASMTETLTQLGHQYEQTQEGIKLVFNFESSGTLKTQIEAGAQCDLFISAGQKQMDELTLGVTDRVNLLENKVVLVTPTDNPAGIDSMDALAQALSEGQVLLAMGNADVPVGQYTQKILAYYGLSEQALAENGCITYGSNVKEVVTQVEEEMVDCGIVYATDACSAGLPVVDTATEAMCGQVIYPAAVLENAPQAQQAREFLSYLRGEEAADVLASVGFTPLSASGTGEK